ncbi:protein Diedel-like [Drosophila rhopaloa]|uniref:Protein Diedel-like n=1 Tax=Drosophila rhopaloa TaxID=1041015 RepID=A0A6P4EUY1_DRORH|nr:protein Diedel-like [Drosophila rhopaloa]
MRAAIGSLLILGVFFIRNATSECCNMHSQLLYSIQGEPCEAVGGQEDHLDPELCTICICGDGKKVDGLYCGEGNCDDFGCNCPGGCRKGNWHYEIVERNKQYNISIVEVVRYLY